MKGQVIFATLTSVFLLSCKKCELDNYANVRIRNNSPSQLEIYVNNGSRLGSLEPFEIQDFKVATSPGKLEVRLRNCSYNCTIKTLDMQSNNISDCDSYIWDIQ